jgi:DNA-binding MarR family transcriptional regulator
MRHTPEGRAVTSLILEIFKLNGRLLAAGDRLTADLGLTSARWQVLGAIALAASPQPVSHLARTMGLTRQGVQRIVNELAAEGFVTFDDNPHHQRAKLVLLTKKGQASFDEATKLQVPWANQLADRLSEKELSAATRLLRTLTQRLETTERT